MEYEKASCPTATNGRCLVSAIEYEHALVSAPTVLVQWSSSNERKSNVDLPLGDCGCLRNESEFQIHDPDRPRHGNCEMKERTKRKELRHRHLLLRPWCRVRS